jgi:hypothetical protein
MNLIPIAVATAFVVAVPQLRRRVAPVAGAVAGGAMGVAGAAVGGVTGVVSAAVYGDRESGSEEA